MKTFTWTMRSVFPIHEDRHCNLQTKKRDDFMKMLKLAVYASFMVVLTASLGFAVINKYSVRLEGRAKVPAVKSEAGEDGTDKVQCDPSRGVLVCLGKMGYERHEANMKKLFWRRTRKKREVAWEGMR